MYSLVRPQVRKGVVTASVLLWLPHGKGMGQSFNDDN